MLETLPADIRVWTEKQIGTIQASQKLKGGISTSIFHLKTATNDFVLRVIDRADWLAVEPDLAPHEAASLKSVAHTNVPTPQLIAYDDAEACSIPVVLSTWLPGKIVLMPDDLSVWLQELAQNLAQLHQLDASDFHWQYQTWVIPTKIANPPQWTQNTHLWHKAAQICHNPPPETLIRLIHRDYHPANVLFHNGHLSGVVDWINACHGCVSLDVATCRNDIACLHGIEAANAFQAYYEAAMGIKHHPLWDLRATLEFFSIDLAKVFKLWQDLGLVDVPESILYQRADNYFADIMKRIDHA
jgi:aminoglycoside phosphotransferase (APT) family kinase protein